MAKTKTRFSNNIQIKNRKASYEYSFIDTYIAGVKLAGTEIKSIREGKASLQEAFCVFFKEELYIKGMHIAPYTEATHYNHDSTRERKLLLNKKELEKLDTKHQEKGLTIVPIRLFINERGWAKIEIALAKGKKVHDKRDSIKEKDLKREMQKIKY